MLNRTVRRILQISTFESGIKNSLPNLSSRTQKSRHSMVMVSGIVRGSANNSAKQLYKYLLRKCETLPSGPQQFYKHSIKQSFKQHVHEPDAERVSQIIEKAYADSKWILEKVTSQNQNCSLESCAPCNQANQ